MFATHNPVIGDYAKSSPDAFEHVFQFVIGTVQQSIEASPAITAGFQLEGSGSRDAWGWKGAALDWMAENKGEAFARACSTYDAAGLIHEFASYPGLGVVKGGFLAQLAFGVGGCVDSHNMKRFGVTPSQFAAHRFKGAKTAATRAKIVNQYCNLIDDNGGCAVLWDGWCDHVASLRPDVFDDGFAVSETHCTALGLKAAPIEIPF